MLHFRIDPTQTLLCRAIADASPAERARAAQDLLAALGDARAFDLAQRNQVAPVVAHAIIDALGPDNVPTHWRQAHEETYRRISAYLAELDRIAARLAEEGVTVVLIENGSLARAIYPCPGCFGFSDLDLLVRREQIPAIHRVLAAAAYTTRPNGSLSQDALDLRNGRAEYARKLANGYLLRLNLQWSLVARRWFSAEGEPDVETLMGRSVPIVGTAARMLCPEDNLFQLAIHNACHAYVHKPGIGLHLDIERFVRRVPVDWHEFLSLVESFRVKTRVYFSLAIPKALFNTPIPNEVLSRLRPPAWKERLITRWLQRVGLFNPDERKFSNAGFLVFSALLYDDLPGLWRAVFPDKHWMRQRYQFHSDLLLPVYHARRLADMALRRVL